MKYIKGISIILVVTLFSSFMLSNNENCIYIIEISPKLIQKSNDFQDRIKPLKLLFKTDKVLNVFDCLNIDSVYLKSDAVAFYAEENSLVLRYMDRNNNAIQFKRIIADYPLIDSIENKLNKFDKIHIYKLENVKIFDLPEIRIGMRDDCYRFKKQRVLVVPQSANFSIKYISTIVLESCDCLLGNIRERLDAE
ncbi:MAG: hypothetical protein WCK02_07425 [Bacteroidota bacterium]